MTSSYLGGRRSSSAARSWCNSFHPVTLPRRAMLASTASTRLSFRQSLNDQGCEVDKRVIARAHDQNAVARASLGNQSIADSRAFGDVLRLFAECADLFS